MSILSYIHFHVSEYIRYVIYTLDQNFEYPAWKLLPTLLSLMYDHHLKFPCFIYPCEETKDPLARLSGKPLARHYHYGVL